MATFVTLERTFEKMRAQTQIIFSRMEAAEDRLRKLIKLTGDPGRCQGCPAEIYWVRHRNGRAAPYDADGRNHFMTCPNAGAFKKRGA